jgi:hypothetical protein
MIGRTGRAAYRPPVDGNPGRTDQARGPALFRGERGFCTLLSGSNDLEEGAMSEVRVGRRQLMKGAGAGAVALAALTLPATSASAQPDSEGSGVEGGWLLTVKNAAPDNGTTKAAVTFGSGGAVASVDLNPPSPVGLGSWKQTEEDGFALTFWQADSDQSRNPGGTIKIHSEGTVDGDDLTGTFTVWVFLADGTQVFTGNGTVTGTRIEA